MESKKADYSRQNRLWTLTQRGTFHSPSRLFQCRHFSFCGWLEHIHKKYIHLYALAFWLGVVSQNFNAILLTDLMRNMLLSCIMHRDHFTVEMKKGFFEDAIASSRMCMKYKRDAEQQNVWTAWSTRPVYWSPTLASGWHTPPFHAVSRFLRVNTQRPHTRAHTQDRKSVV